MSSEKLSETQAEAVLANLNENQRWLLMNYLANWFDGNYHDSDGERYAVSTDANGNLNTH